MADTSTHQVKFSAEEAKRILTEILGIIGESKTRAEAGKLFHQRMGLSSTQAQTLLDTSLTEFGCHLHMPWEQCQVASDDAADDDKEGRCIDLVDPEVLTKKLTEIFNMP